MLQIHTPYQVWPSIIKNHPDKAAPPPLSHLFTFISPLPYLWPVGPSEAVARLVSGARPAQLSAEGALLEKCIVAACEALIAAAANLDDLDAKVSRKKISTS